MTSTSGCTQSHPMMPGYKDPVESCNARAHDTREWDLKVNGDVQIISKRVVPDA